MLNRCDAMKQISLVVFLDGVEKGSIVNTFGQVVVGSEKRVYGMDYSYDFIRAQAGKICELVYMVVP